MALRTVAAAAVLLLASGCAAPKESWGAMRVPEVQVEILPRAAVLEVDGQVLGPGSRMVPVPDGGRPYRLKASAAGFEAREVTAPGEKLSGGRVSLVLRPQGFGSSRPLDADEPSGLALAAAVLLRAGRLDDARDYAERSLELGEVPLSHRVLGAVFEKEGKLKKAAQHYSIYLSLAPDAPDAEAISRAVERARGDLTIPGGEEATPSGR